jgi:hypothetical protein
MTKDIPLLVISFLLTTVAGGFLGTYLQQRSWKRQNEARLREEELRRADMACQTVSALIDKRRYRMVRLLNAMQEYSAGRDVANQLDPCREAYDAVLFEYNDRLNVHFSLVGTYFGERARAWLQDEVHATFVRAGEHFVRAGRAAGAEAAGAELASAASELDALNEHIYRLSVFMMAMLREGRVGRQADDALPPGLLKPR